MSAVGVQTWAVNHATPGYRLSAAAVGAVLRGISNCWSLVQQQNFGWLNYRILIITREASENISTFINLYLSPPSKGGGGASPPLNHDKRAMAGLAPLDPPLLSIK